MTSAMKAIASRGPKTMKIKYDGRLGLYPVPDGETCPICGTVVTEKERMPGHNVPAMQCQKCGKRWIVALDHGAGKATMYQHLRCTNDTNGNPRRIFVFMDATGAIVAVEDEGYRGTPAACRGLVQLPTIETYLAERRELLRTYPTLKQAQEARK